MQREDIDRQGSAVVLARALAHRLGGVAPPGIRVVSRGGEVVVSDGRSSDGTSLVPLVDQPGEVEENLVTAASATLGTVQDFTIESLGEPWPRRQGGPSRSLDPGSELPLPAARIDGRTMRLWFGEPESPALELRPIDLTEIL
jgi:hypothetical protein